jgi:hypothetical protein
MEIKKQHPRSAFRQRASKKTKLTQKLASQAVLFQLFDRDLLLKSRTSTPQTSSPFSIQKTDTAFCPHSQVARVLTRPCVSCQGL